MCALIATTPVMFTDIVGSTIMAADLGDKRWKELLDSHDEITRTAVERFGGRVVIILAALTASLAPVASQADHSGSFNSCELHIGADQQPALTGEEPSCSFLAISFGTVVGQVQGNGLVGMRIEVAGLDSIFPFPSETASCGPTLLACSTAEQQLLLINGTNEVTCTYTGPLALAPTCPVISCRRASTTGQS